MKTMNNPPTAEPRRESNQGSRSARHLFWCQAARRWAFFLLLAACAGPLHAKEVVVRVDLESATALQIEELLKLHPDVLGWGRDWADLLVSESTREAISDIGLDVEIIIPDIRAYEQDLRERDYFDHFHDYQEILQEIQQAEIDHPAIAKIHDIGDAWEKTAGIADRDIWAVKISDSVDVHQPRAGSSHNVRTSCPRDHRTRNRNASDSLSHRQLRIRSTRHPTRGRTTDMDYPDLQS